MFEEEIPLGNNWFRQAHRWLSIAFTVAVVVNIIAMVQEKSAIWVGFPALLPLGLLLITGPYMFVLPYVTKRRDAERAG